MYKCISEQGVKSFSDRPCSGQVLEKPTSGPPAESALAARTASSSDTETANNTDAGFSAALTLDSIQGTWLITMIGKEKTADLSMGEDFWEFSGNKMTVISSGRRLRPDNFSVKGQSIMMAGNEISVLEFDGQRLKVDTFGTIQVLERR